MPHPRVLVLLLCCYAPAYAVAAPSHELRTFLEGLDAGAAPLVARRPLHHPQLLSDLYRQRNYRPIWTSDGPLESQLADLLTAIGDSAAHGLNSADYHHQQLITTLQQRDSNDNLTLELLAADAFLEQVRHRSTGAVSPRELDRDWHLIKPEVDALETLRNTAASGAPVREVLDRLWPKSSEYRELVDLRARILSLGGVDVVQVPAGPLLKPGSNGERVVLLKQRLLGPGEHNPWFDDELGATVVLFQRAAGLEPDGIVGDATLEVMNASRFSWIDRIDANLERWRWLPAEEPDTYVRVNLAAFRLRVVRAGEEVIGMDVIVGRPYRRTPVFTETIKYLVFNPFWNVPYKLAVQDKLPVLKRDPGELEAQGLRGASGGTGRLRARHRRGLD